MGSNELESGTLQMKEVCRLMGGKGNIVVMMGDLSNQAARQRTKDVEDVIATPACKGIKIVEKQTAKWSRTEGRDLVMNWLSAGVKFDAVVSNNDEMALGAIQALKAAKRSNVIVAGVDATRDALTAMKSGDMKVTVFQNGAGQGRGAIDVALKLAKGEKVPPMNYIPFELVTPANLKNYEARN
ncbi:ABC-type sugar transport system substrate-binding protein [Vogesella perlucida]|nr:ABC-type sugar transport system substrate-binding protein [Vogesella perlucida]